MIPIQGDSWRKAVMQGMHRSMLPEAVCHELAAGSWRLDGRLLADGHSLQSMADATLRFAFPGLPGGMPPKRKYQDMSLKELRNLCIDSSISRRHPPDANGKHLDKCRAELVAEFQAWEEKKRLDRERKATPTAKALRSTPDALKKRRAQEQSPAFLEKARKAHKAKRTFAEPQRSSGRFQFAQADRIAETCGSAGTWEQAARIIADVEGSQALPRMPPSFVALNDRRCLRLIRVI